MLFSRGRVLIQKVSFCSALEQSKGIFYTVIKKKYSNNILYYLYIYYSVIILSLSAVPSSVSADISLDDVWEGFFHWLRVDSSGLLFDSRNR